MRRFLAGFAAVLILVGVLGAATSTGGYALISWDSIDPSGACTRDQGLFVNTANLTVWACPTTTWKQLARTEEVTTTTGLQFPAGAIMMIASGSCPTGFTESSAMSGKFPLGTVTANADIGVTGGSDNITPAGTNAAITAGTPAGTNGTVNFTPAGTNGTVNFTPVGTVAAPTFTGNSVASSAVSAGTPAGTNGASATSGNCAATNIAAGTGSTTACKATAPALTVTAQTFTGSALGTHTHTTTATGTNTAPAFTGTQGAVPAETFTGTQGTVPAETFTGSALGTHTHTFTGTQFDNRPAFVKVIYCIKN